MDKEAATYIGLTIEWDYENGKVHMFMPGYLAKAMIRFKHETPNKIQNSPHCHIEIYNTEPNNSMSMMKKCCPPLSIKKRKKYVQAVAGTLLYYARAVDSTILPALSSLATKQAKPT